MQKLFGSIDWKGVGVAFAHNRRVPEFAQEYFKPQLGLIFSGLSLAGISAD